MPFHMMNVYLYEYITGAKNKGTINNCLVCKGHKLKQKKLHLNLRKNFFTLRGAGHWKSLQIGLLFF